MQTMVRFLFYFFSYSFVGWIWETLYVYLRTGRWENRGFLFGPFLPIYGLGALTILYATAPVTGRPWLIFLFGMLSATALEYIGGSLLELLFHTRYWDYSQIPFNLHGHICLYCSLVWGLFSLCLVYWLHPFVERFSNGISLRIQTAVTLLLLLYLLSDIAFTIRSVCYG